MQRAEGEKVLAGTTAVVVTDSVQQSAEGAQQVEDALVKGGANMSEKRRNFAAIP